jgi:hypothetical protein
VFEHLFPRQVNCTRTERLPVSADEAWAIVGDLGSNVIGAGMVERVEVSGSGTGAIRTFHLPGGARVIERIESYDAAGRRYVYRIIDSGPLPMARYVGMAEVTPAGPEACLLSWSGTADSIDGDSEGLREFVEGNLSHAVTAVARHLSAEA